MGDLLYYQAVITGLGAHFCGIQRGPRATLILFSDPEFESTLAVTEQEFSVESVARRLQESKRAFCP